MAIDNVTLGLDYLIDNNTIEYCKRYTDLISNADISLFYPFIVGMILLAGVSHLFNRIIQMDRFNDVKYKTVIIEYTEYFRNYPVMILFILILFNYIGFLKFLI